MKIPANAAMKKRKKKRRKATSEKPPTGGRAYQRIVQESAARGLEAPKIYGLVTDDRGDDFDQLVIEQAENRTKKRILKKRKSSAKTATKVGSEKSKSKNTKVKPKKSAPRRLKPVKQEKATPKRKNISAKPATSSRKTGEKTQTWRK